MSDSDIELEAPLNEALTAIIHSCSYCLPATKRYSLQELYTSFHEPCTDGICSRPDAAQISLCDSCRHFRLWHNLRCRRDVSSIVPWITPSVASNNIDCRLCCILHSMVERSGRSGVVAEVARMTVRDAFINGCKSKVVFSAEATDDQHQWIGTMCFQMDSPEPLQPLVGEWVSWSRLRSITQACFRTHSSCLRACEPQLPEGFRVIDVARRCVVQQRVPRYVALSYVWGQDAGSSLFASTQTVQQLAHAGSLSADRLPATIQDALVVCEQLGEPFLWIDRLCILQDDLTDKQHQIGAMDRIFSAAEYVIIALHGTGVNYGLPGVGHARQAWQLQVALPGGTGTIVARDKSPDETETWPTRGWTYQEGVLARRRLYFTNTRVFFECEQAISHEDMYNSKFNLEIENSTKLILPTDNSAFSAYTRHARNYASLQLRYRSDAYSAFAGISNALFGPNSTHFGLPLSYFDWALHWQNDLDATAPLEAEEQCVRFPTWTWMSRVTSPCAIEYARSELIDDDYCGALLAWYRFDETSIDDLRALNDHSVCTLTRNWRFYMSIAHAAGCTSQYLQTSHIHWPDYETYYQHLAASKPHVSPATRHALRSTPGAIIGCTQVSSFPVMTRGHTSYILDAQGHIIGEITDTSAQDHSARRHEFIALGLIVKPPGYKVSRGDSGTERNVSWTEAKGVPVVTVMQVRWEGAVAYREGVGHVYLRDWVEAGREWRDVILA